jgi:hypothetical protein
MEANIPIFLIIGFSVGFLILTGILIKYAIKKEKQIYEEGIETDSVVSRTESRMKSHHGSGRIYHCYVTFIGNDGKEHEALLNLRSDLPIGREVRIKYLPNKYDEAVFISQEL